MFRQSTILAARLCTSRTQCTLAKNSFNLEAAKARTMHWEPTLKFDDTRPNTPQQHTEKVEEDDISWLTTYSVFDPGFTRPFPIPLMSRPPLSLFSFDNQREGKNEEVKGALKPLPYRLPKFLRPRAGTMFSRMNGTSTTPTRNKSKRVGPPGDVVWCTRA
jgi:hypothetical protein